MFLLYLWDRKHYVKFMKIVCHWHYVILCKRHNVIFMYLFRIFNFSKFSSAFGQKYDRKSSLSWFSIPFLSKSWRINFEKLNILNKYMKTLFRSSISRFFFLPLLFWLCCYSAYCRHLLPLLRSHLTIVFLPRIVCQHVSPPPLLPTTQIYCNISHLWNLCRI